MTTNAGSNESTLARRERVTSGSSSRGRPRRRQEELTRRETIPSPPSDGDDEHFRGLKTVRPPWPLTLRTGSGSLSSGAIQRE